MISATRANTRLVPRRHQAATTPAECRTPRSGCLTPAKDVLLGWPRLPAAESCAEFGRLRTVAPGTWLSLRRPRVQPELGPQPRAVGEHCAVVLPPLLRENANFRRYFIGQSVSLLGDQISLIALPLTAVLALHATAGPDGRADDRALVPEPALLAARRQLGRPPRPTARGDARDRLRPRAADRDRPDRLRIRPPHLGAALRRRVPDRHAQRLLLRRLRRVLPGRRARARTTSRRTRSSTAAARSRSSPARASAACSCSCCAAPTRSRSTRSRSSGLRSSSAASTPRSRPARRTSRRADRPARAGSAATRSSAPSCSASRRSTSSTSCSSRCSCSTRRATLARSPRDARHRARRRVGRHAARARSSPHASRGGSASAQRSSLGCFLFPAPLILVPAAGGPHWLVLALLFVAEFLSGIGLMLLDIMAGTISAGTVPTALRSRVSGAFMVVNYGVRPLGTALGGCSARRSACARRSGSRRSARCRPALDPAPVADPVAARRAGGGAE